MDLQEWKIKNGRRRNYAHFDKKVSLGYVWEYINNPEKVAKHSFYPFIHYEQSYDKYNKKKGIKPKKREICYSAHIDRYIFQFYGYKLNQLYDKRVENDNIIDTAIAYRDNLHKNNINFAKKAIDFIREKLNCFIIVGDFTKFFENLDHKYLKWQLCDLLRLDRLPADYYAVYKNITKFSTWDMESLLDLNNLPHNSDGRHKLNELDQALSLEQFKQNKKQNIKPHEENFGIPQGSAISAVLSNIYMLQFDRNLNDYVSDQNGLYMRYSDDFIIVLPQKGKDTFKGQFTYIKNIIDSIPNLVLQPDKTQIYKYSTGKLQSCNELVLSDVKNESNLLNYLGFTFDGEVVTIRDKTISKYYYRMYRKIKTIVKNNGYTKHKHRISFKKIYTKYSEKGAKVGQGNFITYVQRAEAVFGMNEAIKRGTKDHMQKIRKRLDMIGKEA